MCSTIEQVVNCVLLCCAKSSCDTDITKIRLLGGEKRFSGHFKVVIGNFLSNTEGEL